MRMQLVFPLMDGQEKLQELVHLPPNLALSAPDYPT